MLFKMTDFVMFDIVRGVAFLNIDENVIMRIS
jgi:hypothetical protein